jgi:hypothetical protein
MKTGIRNGSRFLLDFSKPFVPSCFIGKKHLSQGDGLIFATIIKVKRIIT